jgi:hypothetical protein
VIGPQAVLPAGYSARSLFELDPNHASFNALKIFLVGKRNMTRNHASQTIGILFATAMAAAGPAFSADLGGDCCTDLEERVAELEATTARKGNRKVSLTISGYVAQEITVWDDGTESNAYIHGLGPTQTSHVKFNGQATIAPGWTAGYMLRLQDLTGNAFSAGSAGSDPINQLNPTKNDAPNTQMSFWYVQSKDLGKVSVGRQAHAAKSAAMFTDVSGTQIIDNYTFLGGFPQFRLRGRSLESHLGPARLLLLAGRSSRRRLQRHRDERRALRHARICGFLGFGKLG